MIHYWAVRVLILSVFTLLFIFIYFIFSFVSACCLILECFSPLYSSPSCLLFLTALPFSDPGLTGLVGFFSFSPLAKG